jgi:hypothetical protein
MQRVLHIHAHNLNELLNHDYNEKPFFLVAGEIIDYGFEAKAMLEHELPSNFPACCQFHSNMLLGLMQWFDRFPHCCEGHQELTTKPWFNKLSYQNLPLKIAKQVAYTFYHIEAKINELNWLKDITDYIEYNIESFGSPAIGSDRYIAEIRNYVENGKMSFWTHHKRRKILEYITMQETAYSKLPNKDTDLNILYDTFQKWIKLVPDISIFKEIKDKYSKKLPMNLIIQSTSYNPYLEWSKSKLTTQTELILRLIDSTKELINKINNESNKHPTLSNLNKQEFAIISERHRVKQTRLGGKHTEGELEYISIIKKWLSNEEKFLLRMKKHLNDSKQSPSTQKQTTLQKTKILFLTSNPLGSDSLRLEDELRKVKDEIQLSTYRDHFELVSESAVKITTITRAIQQQAPKIVHFSGHGSGSSGLVVQDDASNAVFVPSSALSSLFELHRSKVKCVVLNACYSQVQAEAISKHGIYVVGMNDSIGDNAASDFAVGFYQSIGEGKNYKYAFRNALINISPNLEDANTPELWFNGKKIY